MEITVRHIVRNYHSMSMHSTEYDLNMQGTYQLEWMLMKILHSISHISE